MTSTRSFWMQILLIAVIILVCVFPFYWMVTTSLKTQIVALEAPPVWIFEPTLNNYREALFEDGVLHTLINSLVIAVSTTILAILRPLLWPGSSFAVKRICGSGLSPTAW